jgi:uncharacterized cupredoxin-like copper-binding protein
MDTRRPACAALLTAGLLAAIAGCSGGGGSNAAGPSSAAAPTTAASGTAVVCGNLQKIDSIPTPDSGPDTQPAPEDVKAWATQISPLIDSAAAQAPPELAPSLNALKPYVAAAVSQGTSPSQEDQVLADAIAAYETWGHDNCGFQNVDLVAKDFTFAGAPSTLKAGPTSILMKNESTGGQFHVALMARPKDQTMTTEQFIALPMEQLMQAVDIEPSAAAAAPGQSGGFVAELKPGKYFLVCPVGGDDGQAPHFMQGMINEVTVT